MKTTLKKLILGLSLLSVGFVYAQHEDMTNMFKMGGNVGIALPSSNASMSAGVDFAYQHLITPGFGLGLTTGYKQYFGKENDGLENNDFGVIPAAGMIRVYSKEAGFFFGSDIGYGFITGLEKVADNSDVERPDGGLYIKPEIGWHNWHWNISLQYTKLFTGSKGEIGSQKYDTGSLGLGITYNFPLGK